MAGLAAARELQLGGRDAIVLEARDRIGGRVHTLRPRGWPVPVEAGAEFVHGRSKVLLPLAREAREVRGGHYSGALERQDDLWASVMEKLVRALAFDWQEDELSRGAYSWVPVRSMKAQRALAKRVGPLHFAGEATDFDGACGTVHGAIATGIRAAREVSARR